MKLKLLRVVGARPQFMQVKPLRTELQKRGHNEVILHTGQHYDDLMSKKFFEDLDLPKADINLGVGSGPHGQQTARMIEGIENHLLNQRYNAVVVDGDTNSTLAGALSAAKLHIPVVHIESGMRSFDKKMPEELNRILTDHMSDLLFCPSEVSKNNLKNEGIEKGVYIVGDVLSQCFQSYKIKAMTIMDDVLKRYRIENGKYALLTLHRAENINDKIKLEEYLKKIATSPWPIIWPIHPHTQKQLADFGLDYLICNKPFIIINPVGYIEMLALEGGSIKILTDSGGVQREAYYWRKPGVILRDSTEWVEIVIHGMAYLFTPEQDATKLWQMPCSEIEHCEDFYGTNSVAEKIVDVLERELL